jgi:hypothetical protein
MFDKLSLMSWLNSREHLALFAFKGLFLLGIGHLIKLCSSEAAFRNVLLSGNDV